MNTDMYTRMYSYTCTYTYTNINRSTHTRTGAYTHGQEHTQTDRSTHTHHGYVKTHRVLINPHLKTQNCTLLIANLNTC